MLPILDLAPLHADDATARTDLARAAATACGDAGGFVATGHRLAAVDELLDIAPAFFAQPREELEAIRANSAGRGYIPMGSGAKPGFLPDAKEAFQANAGQPIDQTDAPARFDGENQWPALNGFRPAVEQGFVELQRLGRELLVLLAIGLELERETFNAYCERPLVTLRLHRYPAIDDDDRRFGAAPHTDFGALGLVAERAPTGGLEALDGRGRWQPVTAPPGTLVVLVGELLAWWSSGLFRALPHRVPVPATTARLSLAAFVNPAVDALLRPLGDTDGEAISTADFIYDLVDRRAAGDISARQS
jgi:isopenicillin N synthase-like dioxygenase